MIPFPLIRGGSVTSSAMAIPFEQTEDFTPAATSFATVAQSPWEFWRRSAITAASLDKAASGAPSFTMANQLQFSILAYQRRPGTWRAAISRKDGAAIKMDGTALKSLITPDDCASEGEALAAAQKAIRLM
jgi:hypothetical protein